MPDEDLADLQRAARAGQPPARQPAPVESGAARRLRRLQTLARVMDAQIGIPFTRFRFGLDALAGIVPGLGDVAGGLVSAWVIVESARLGASKATLTRMLGNVALETLVGLVPVAGDLFDAAWRSNLRNVALLERHLDAPERTARASRLFLLGILGSLLGVIVFVAALTAWAVQGLFRVLA